MTAYKAIDIAKWFISYAEANEADISNLKLQKLLYYAQGHYLAAKSSTLFCEDIEAWAHGPVVTEVYHAFKKHGSADIQLDAEDDFSFDQVDSETTQFLLDIWQTYGQYSAWGLRNKTHSEPPWIESFNQGPRTTKILASSIKSYFSTLRAEAQAAI